MTSVTVQRWISDQQRDIFCRLLKPVMDQNSGWTFYEIDDDMFDGTFLGTEDEKKALIGKYGSLVENSIPRFNRGRGAFEGERTQKNIRTMLNSADFVTVTTEYLKRFYHDFYGVPEENILAVPNLMPKWWIGDRYDPEKKLRQFASNKAKPRIGIVSSLSHYNIDGVREDGEGRACRRQKRPDGSEIWVNEAKQEIPEAETRAIADDIDAVIDCIRETADDFQWVFFGYCPPKLQDLVDRKKLEVHGGVPLMNYPSKFESLGLQAIVAPINPIGFNFCKSFIKYMEAAALGVPCFCTKCLPYTRVMPESQLFTDGNDLKDKLTKLKFASSGLYEKMISGQWKWLNSEHDEGDFHISNFWIEDNLSVYIDRFRMRQKALAVSLDCFVKQYDARKQKEKENTIFRNDNILITR